MNKRFLLSAVTVLSIVVASGCAVNKKQRTLGALDENEVKIEKNIPIDSARQKAMANYREFMNSTPKDTQRVEALRRLADLELERAEESFQTQAQQSAESAVEQSPPAVTTVPGDVNYTKAIKLYEDAVKSATGTQQDAEVLYQLSKAYEQAGERTKALNALNQLLAKFPDMDNRDELHFRRGELNFSLGNYEEAERAYTQTMVVDSASQFYEKALLKKGWSAYKQNNFAKALHSFFNLVERKLRADTGELKLDASHLSRGEKELLIDVYRVITLSFNELGGANAVTTYFKQNGTREYEPVIYRNLGEHYISQERFKDATEAFLAFVQRSPMHPMAFEFDMLRVDAVTKGGFAGLLIDFKMEFVDTYQVNGAYWKHQDETVQAKLIPILEGNIEEIARHFHSQAQSSKQDKDYELAIAWYKKYIDWFPKREKTQRMNFLLAELLFDNKKYEQAAKEYEITAYQYQVTGHDAEAGYAALLAYNEHAKNLSGKQKEVWDRLSIASALRFGKAFPNDKRAAAAVTKAAEDLFAMNKYDQAAVAARSILELTTETDPTMRRTAWLIVAQAEMQDGKYARAESAYKIAIRLAKPGDEVYATIEKGLAAAMYKAAEELREKGDYKSAAEQFNRVVNLAPNSEIAISAQYDMASSLVAKKDWNAAIPALEKFRSKYPHNRFNRQIGETLAAAYLETHQPIQAAREFEGMLAYQSSVDVRRDMSWKIAELYEQAGMTDEVVESLKKFVQSFPRPVEQAMEARQKLADIYQKSNQRSKRQYWLSEIVKKTKQAGEEGSDRVNFLAASAAFELAGPTLDSFNDVQLVAPLQDNLKRKKEKMQQAVNAYTEAANYGVEEVTTASIYLLGEIYNKFGKELLKSERPQGLSAEEKEQYDILLEEQAFPFEEKSINIHESNIQRIRDGTYNEWIKKSFAALSNLRPVRYGKAERSELVADRIH